LTSVRYLFQRQAMLGRLVLGICATLSLGLSAQAADPRWVAVSDGGYAVDQASVRKDGELVAGTYRQDLKKARKAPSGPTYVALVGAVRADCGNGRLQRLTSDYLAADGVLIQQTRSGRWSELTETSALKPVFESLCGQPLAARAPSALQRVSVGTAWATDRGYLVTAAHVVEGGKTIEVLQDGEKRGVALLIASDPDNDVAVLKYVPASPRRLRIIPMADKPAGLGKSVFTLGYPEPAVLGQRVKMTAGNVSGEAGLADDARFLQISAPIQQGNSGGPLLGYDGKAVGMVSAKLERFDNDKASLRPENVNYAVKADYLKPLLRGLPDLGGYAPVRSRGSLEDLIAQAKDAVFMLVVTP
jgi:S1-C subfamily serine protease